jgi:predicted glycosyltransferase
LLGIGHLKRASAIARAMALEGMEVTLASGGMPLPGLALDGLRFVQLPPVMAADATFKVLVDGDQKPIDASWKERRRELLLEAWHKAEPHALVFELFPFGRRQMRFELEPLLDAARSSTRKPVIVSSVRDILGGGQTNPGRQAEMLAMFDRYFDHLLVHGDPKMIPFDRTFLHAGKLAERLHYTGYVVDGDARRSSVSGLDKPGDGEVVVSAGGGAVGFRLLDCAIRARPLSLLHDRTWRILVGVNADRAEFDRLVRLAEELGAGRVIVETARADFTELLENCAVSVSQGGYNTVIEVLQSRACAVVVPFAGGSESEQTLRTVILAERGMIEMVDEVALEPNSLAAAVDRAAGRSKAATGLIDLGGAKQSTRLVSEWTSGLQW